METNPKVLALTLLVVGLTTVPSLAQTSGRSSAQTPVSSGSPNPPMGIPGDRPDGPPPGGPGKHHRPGPPNGPNQQRGPGGPQAGLTSLTTVTGTVGKLTSNDDFLFDGFMLQAGSAPATLVSFPPHLGKQVQSALANGNSVSVTGFSEARPDGEIRFRMTSLTAGKTTVQDAPPALPTTPVSAPALTSATGKIADYRLDREGRVNGLVLSDNTLIQIPSNVSYQLANLATKGETITVQGYPKAMREGQVQLQQTNVLRASVLTINGQQYLVR